MWRTATRITVCGTLEYGLMRPEVVGSDEAKGLELSTYPVMQYGIKPPYWKPCNMRLCHVPIATAENATT